jgi:hypothetical protein
VTVEIQRSTTVNQHFKTLFADTLLPQDRSLRGRAVLLSRTDVRQIPTETLGAVRVGAARQHPQN